MGYMTKVTEPNPGGGANLDTLHSFDLLDHLTQVNMTRGGVTQTRSFNYDSVAWRPRRPYLYSGNESTLYINWTRIQSDRSIRR
ncbi:MAG: hypothetical protein ACR2NN_23095 [Bryobacteraceae bacterium]